MNCLNSNKRIDIRELTLKTGFSYRILKGGAVISTDLRCPIFASVLIVARS